VAKLRLQAVILVPSVLEVNGFLFKAISCLYNGIDRFLAKLHLQAVILIRSFLNPSISYVNKLINFIYNTFDSLGGRAGSPSRVPYCRLHGEMISY